MRMTVTSIGNAKKCLAFQSKGMDALDRMNHWELIPSQMLCQIT